jgi:signal peptidase II
MKLTTGVKSILIILLVLTVDQVTKILVKTHMSIGESIHIFDWFQIKFIENPGMAFGLDIPGKFGKPMLTVFRMIAVAGIGWYMNLILKKGAKPGLMYFMAFIFAGAMGNIIDCTIYGRIFSESTYFSVATLFPEGGGYAPVLHGQVVDMFYFPLLHGIYPYWVPWVGGQEYVFFRPIFNIADASISTGIIAILLFQKRYFSEPESAEESLKEKEVENAL